MDKASEHVAHFLNSIVEINERHLTELRLKLASQLGASNVMQSVDVGVESLTLNVQFIHESGRWMNWTLSVNWPVSSPPEQCSEVWTIGAIVDISETTEHGSCYDIVRDLPARETTTLSQCIEQVDAFAQALTQNWDAVLICSHHVFNDA